MSKKQKQTQREKENKEKMRPEEVLGKLTPRSFGRFILDYDDLLHGSSFFEHREKLFFCHVARHLADEKLHCFSRDILHLLTGEENEEERK